MKTKITFPKKRVEHTGTESVFDESGKIIDRIHHFTETWEFDILMDVPKPKKKKRKKP